MKNKAEKPNGRIPEKVLVELIYEEGGFQRDAELPTNMPVGILRKGLLTLLQEKEPRIFSKLTEITISICGEALIDKLTLAEIGAWDGTTLELSSGKRARTFRSF